MAVWRVVNPEAGDPEPDRFSVPEVVLQETEEEDSKK